MQCIHRKINATNFYVYKYKNTELICCNSVEGEFLFNASFTLKDIEDIELKNFLLNDIGLDVIVDEEMFCGKYLDKENFLRVVSLSDPVLYNSIQRATFVIMINKFIKSIQDSQIELNRFKRDI